MVPYTSSLEEKILAYLRTDLGPCLLYYRQEVRLQAWILCLFGCLELDSSGTLGLAYFGLYSGRDLLTSLACFRSTCAGSCKRPQQRDWNPQVCWGQSSGCAEMASGCLNVHGKICRPGQIRDLTLQATKPPTYTELPKPRTASMNHCTVNRRCCDERPFIRLATRPGRSADVPWLIGRHGSHGRGLPAVCLSRKESLAWAMEAEAEKQKMRLRPK